jgi:ectoine hydroxylase-related dioxygenase (phytanoyl-CoA dioxygenase family)
MPLTQAQKDKYANDGYIVVENVLTPGQLAALREKIHALQNATPDVQDGVKRETETPSGPLRKLNALVPISSFFKDLASSSTILDVAAELTDDAKQVWLYADQVFLKPAHCGSEKPLHQDNSYFHVTPMSRGVTCWLAIDDATPENGCMRYIPGSHKLGLIPHRQIRDTTHLTPEDAGYIGKEIHVPVPAGAAIFHHLLTLHSSGANTSDKPRRAWALHYANGDATCPHMPREKMTLLRG